MPDINHLRIQHLVLGITAVYVLVLALWVGWVAPRTPPGTIPYQATFLFGMFGSSLGIAFMLLNREPKAERQLRRKGLEGWAHIDAMRMLGPTGRFTDLVELDVTLTVPGLQTRSGRLTYEVSPVDRDQVVVGRTVSVRVDPRNPRQVLLLP
jgi:hypothetical protein